jgi:carboxyl-terminal processing protease
MIVSAKGRLPSSMQEYRATPGDVADGLPIVVLVNGGTASAAEIVAAALQDSGRAVVVGSSSYGKGTVQTVLELLNDGELILTSAKLISPAGYSLHEHGVVPSICTAGLPDDDRSVGTVIGGIRPGVQLALATQPRLGLDDTGWGELRRSCPAEHDDRHRVDLETAKRLLRDPILYTRALHAEAPEANSAAQLSH